MKVTIEGTDEQVSKIVKLIRSMKVKVTDHKGKELNAKPEKKIVPTEESPKEEVLEGTPQEGRIEEKGKKSLLGRVFGGE